MNNKVNYTLIGSLVFGALALMLLFTYWLLQPASAQDTKKYNIHFDESVLGLNVDSVVKYRGISVGKVVALQINPDNIEQVEVLITILETTPIKEDTLAQLTSQGITGLSYINLSLGSREAKDLVANEGNEYPIIKTRPSFFNNFETSLDSVSSQLSSTLNRTNKLLDEENQREITAILKSTASLMGKLDRTLDEETILHLQSSVKSLDNIAKKADEITPNLDKLLTTNINLGDDLTGSYESVIKSYGGVKSSLQELLDKVGSMVDTYDKDPSEILFKEEIKK